MVDLGPLVNNLEMISDQKKNMHLATHCFQLMYQAMGGFRWPVAYCGMHNVNPHQIYQTFWPLVDVLSSFGFQVHAALLDGSNNNRYFMNTLINPESARCLKYISSDMYDVSHIITFTQDCKHTLKKNLEFYSEKFHRDKVSTYNNVGWKTDIMGSLCTGFQF